MSHFLSSSASDAWLSTASELERGTLDLRSGNICLSRLLMSADLAEDEIAPRELDAR